MFSGEKIASFSDFFQIKIKISGLPNTVPYVSDLYRIREANDTLWIINITNSK